MSTERKDPGFDQEITAAESPTGKSKRPSVVPPSLIVRPRLMDHSERIAAYGSPAALRNGVLKPDPAWEAYNLVRINVPWPGGTIKTMKVHRATVHKWTVFFENVKKAGLLDRFKTFAGAHNCRMKRGYEKSTNLAHLSTHSFGAAADFNAAWNPLGAMPAAKGQPGSLVELVPIAYDCGMCWGGDFGRCDPMHFEVGVER